MEKDSYNREYLNDQGPIDPVAMLMSAAVLTALALTIAPDQTEVNAQEVEIDCSNTCVIDEARIDETLADITKQIRPSLIHILRNQEGLTPELALKDPTPQEVLLDR